MHELRPERLDRNAGAVGVGSRAAQVPGPVDHGLSAAADYFLQTVAVAQDAASGQWLVMGDEARHFVDAGLA